MVKCVWCNVNRAMSRAALLAVVCVIGAAMGCDRAPTVDLEADKRNLEAVMREVNTAWETEDLTAFSRVVAHDEDMVSFGADVGERWVGWDAIEKGLQRQFEAFDDTEVTPQHIDIRVAESGRLAWIAQTMEINTKFLGSPIALEARITAVFAKRDARWLLVQFHYSVPISESQQLGS